MNEVKPFYNRSLDGIRGFAMLLVIMSHTELIRYGWFGISIFFILSGYLITRILLAEKEKPVALKVKFKNFWGRRLLRIFPLYYLYLFFLIILWSCTGDWHEYANRLPWLFSYTFNFFGLVHHQSPYFMTGHLWSLSVEEQFYLFYPFLILLCSKKVIRAVAIGLILFAVCFRFFAGHYLLATGVPGVRTGAIIYASTFSHLDAIMLGGCLALFNISRIPVKLINIILPALSVVIIALGLFVFTHIRPGTFSFNEYITHLGYNPDISQLHYYVWSYTLIDLFFALLMLILIYPGHFFWHTFFTRVFSFAPLVAIGKISYGMYIIHMGIKHLLLPVVHGAGIYNKYFVFVIYGPVLYGCAWVIYQLYEKRFLLMKEKFR